MEKTKNCESCSFKQVCDILIEAYLEEESKYKSNSNFYEAQTILNGMLIRARDKICSHFANTNIPSPNPDPNPYLYYPCPYSYYIPIVTYSLQNQPANDPKKEQFPAEYYVPTRTDGGK
jgi:hypothetical protein